MNVLIVDDDRSTRFLIARTLGKRFGCQVTEAGDGRQALEALEAGSFRLAILDVQMPVMDGLETLRALRESPRYASLPVVMLTGERDETVIREILELGVLEYLAKPLNMARLNDRIRRMLRAVGTRADGVPVEPGWLGHALRNAAAPFIVVDGRAPFRRCFLETFGSRRPVIEAPTGVGAMRDIVAARPSAAFIGTDLGVLSEPLLVRKIRAMPTLVDLALFAVVDDEQEADARMTNYDGTLMRTLSPETLLKRMGELLRIGAPSGWETAGFPTGFRASVLLLGEQVFGTAVATDIALCDLPVVSSGERTVVKGTLELPSGDVSLELICDMATARRAAINLFGVDARMVQDDTAVPAVAKVFELLSQRLGNVYGPQEGNVPEPPTVTRVPQWTPPPPSQPGVTVCFETAAKDHEFWLALSPVRT